MAATLERGMILCLTLAALTLPACDKGVRLGDWQVIDPRPPLEATKIELERWEPGPAPIAPPTDIDLVLATTQPIVAPATAPATEAATGPASEPATGPSTEPTTSAATEPSTAPATQAATTAPANAQTHYGPAWGYWGGFWSASSAAGPGGPGTQPASPARGMPPLNRHVARLKLDLNNGRASLIDIDGRAYPLQLDPATTQKIHDLVASRSWQKQHIEPVKDTTKPIFYALTVYNGDERVRCPGFWSDPFAAMSRAFDEDKLSHDQGQWALPPSEPLHEGDELLMDTFDQAMRYVHPLSEKVNLIK